MLDLNGTEKDGLPVETAVVSNAITNTRRFGNMKTVFKYPLEAVKTDLDLPIGSDVVLVASQNDSTLPTLWIEVDQDQELQIQRHFHIVGTGTSAPDEGVHRGSAVCGPYVWHIYEV